MSLTWPILISEINPRYVLRNWMAQSAIQKAEENDFSEVRNFLSFFCVCVCYSKDCLSVGLIGTSLEYL